MTTSDNPRDPGLEITRRLNALQTAALDDTLPREMREAEIYSMWNEFGPLCLITAGVVAGNRATLGIRAAEAAGARSLPVKELRRMVPDGISPQVREAAIDLVMLFRRPRLNWEEIERRGDVIRDSPNPIDGFIALLGLAHGLATLLVAFSPEYATVSDVVRAEALALEGDVS